MKTLKLITYSLLASLALSLAQSAQAELVYNNSTALTGQFNPGILEVGDEIVLAGGSRTLTNFTFQYAGSSFSGSEKAQLRIYANDGALVSGYASPGSLLYDSGSFSISAFPAGQNLIFDDFGSWDAVVPDTFTWSIQFSDLGLGADASLSLFNPVTVGGNYADYWENNGGWILKQGVNPINFGATVEAVPEPSTVALGAIGAVAGLVALRRRQRR